jgi:peptidoglycan/LPS O-acetylase OafA/YrhL
MGHLYLSKPMTVERLRAYAAARISRIVPLYYTVVLVGFLIGMFVDSDFKYAMSAEGLLRHLMFFGSTSVFWSIGPEFQFYFAFPILWWICSLPPARAWRWGCAIGVLVVVVILYRASWPGVSFLSKLHIFLAGCALAPLRQRIVRHLDERSVTRLQLLAVAGLIVLLLPDWLVGSTIYPHVRGDPSHDRYYLDMGKLAWMAATILPLTMETRFANLIFANPVARHLGRCSFSIYLLNVPILYALQKTGLLDQLHVVPALLLALASVLLAATCSFFLLEETTRVRARALVHGLLVRIGPGAGPASPQPEPPTVPGR